MTHDDTARVADLLARPGDGDSKVMIDAEPSGTIGAAPQGRTGSRSNKRNCSRSRLLSTPVGDGR